jgi:hypothetical protein
MKDLSLTFVSKKCHARCVLTCLSRKTDVLLATLPRVFVVGF